MKKILVALAITAIGHCAIAQSVTPSTGSNAPYYAVGATDGLNDDNYTVEVTVDGYDVYMKVTGVEFIPETYYITDMLNNVVQQGIPDVSNNTMHVVFDANLPAGDYLITGQTRNNSFTNRGQLLK